MSSDPFQEYLAQRWKGATERWEDRLGSFDFKEAERLGRPGSNLDHAASISGDIERLEGYDDSPWLQDLSSNLRAFVPSMKPFTMWVALVLQRTQDEITIVWGALRLLTSCASSSKATSIKFANTQTELRKLINKSIRHAESMPDDNDQKEGVMDICIALVDLWIDCTKFVRRNKPDLDNASESRPARTTRQSSKVWGDLEDICNGHKAEIEHTLMNLRSLSEIAARRPSTVEPSNPSSLPTAAKDHAQFPILVLPIPENPDFIGREKILERMDKHLNAVGREPSLQSFTVHGFGGVGKTQVALQYAYKHRQCYDAIFWIDSETAVSTRQSFLKIALELRLSDVGERDNAEKIRMAVDTWLRTTERNWLLIFDNVESWETILNYWPRHPGCAIITSRDYRLAGRPASDGEELKPLGEDESYSLLRSFNPDWNNDDEAEVQAARKLLTYLDGHPLAIDQICGLMNSYQMSAQEFLDLYQRESVKIHSEPHTHIFYPKSLDMVWKVTFDNFSKTQSTLHFLGVLSLMSSTSIPQELFEPRDDLQLPGHLSFCRNQMSLMKEVQKLRGAAVMHKTRRSFQIHRLTQTLFLQHADEPTLSDIFHSACILLEEAFPKQTMGDPMFEKWSQCQTYIQHGQSLAQRFLELHRADKKIKAPLSFIELLKYCAWFLQETSETESCAEILEAAYLGCDFCEADDAAELEIAKSHLLNTDGVNAYRGFDYKRSEEVLFEASKILKKHLDPLDDRIAGCLNNLSNLWAAQGQFDKALGLVRDSQAKIKSSENPTSVDLCRASLNLARLYRATGKFDKARKELGTAEMHLEGDEMRGRFPQWTAAADFISGDIHGDLNELDEAKKKYSSSLRLRENHQPGDAAVAATMYKLARVCIKRKEIKGAKKLLVEGLKIAMRKQSRGNMGRILEQLEIITLLEKKDAGCPKHNHNYQARADAIRESLPPLHQQGLRDDASFFDMHVPFFDR